MEGQSSPQSVTALDHLFLNNTRLLIACLPACRAGEGSDDDLELLADHDKVAHRETRGDNIFSSLVANGKFPVEIKDEIVIIAICRWVCVFTRSEISVTKIYSMVLCALQMQLILRRKCLEGTTLCV